MNGEDPETGSLARSPGTWPAAAVTFAAIAIISNSQAVRRQRGCGDPATPRAAAGPQGPSSPQHEHGNCLTQTSSI